MTQEDMAQLSREELIEMVLAEHAQLEASQAIIAQLKMDLKALKMKLEKGKKPLTNSSNSSQPPSRDQKADLSKKRKRHKHGPPVGHVKYERKFVAEPDHMVEVKPEVCEDCQTDLRETGGQLADVNQITELPEGKAEVIEVRQYEVQCPCCGKKQTTEPPAGLEMERTFGARLEATVVYFRQEQHMSYVRTEAALRDLHAVKISPGGIDKIMQRGGSPGWRAIGADPRRDPGESGGSQ
jgi:transposase